MKTKKKITLISVCSFVGALVLALAIPFTILGVKTAGIKNEWEYLKDNAAYSKKVEVEGINLVKQHISCGYATIEMMSDFYGEKITEDDLDKKNNGGVSTSSTKGFYSIIDITKFKVETFLL